MRASTLRGRCAGCRLIDASCTHKTPAHLTPLIVIAGPLNSFTSTLRISLRLAHLSLSPRFCSPATEVGPCGSGVSGSGAFPAQPRLFSQSVPFVACVDFLLGYFALLFPSAMYSSFRAPCCFRNWSYSLSRTSLRRPKAWLRQVGAFFPW